VLPCVLIDLAFDSPSSKKDSEVDDGLTAQSWNIV
jgi:hypothetical protein